ncbi:hypothetical protein J3R83DRAFT_11255 [Lanmaoa asiatica]|nr:hypothetical protein J3R83DRAFT_11255 [Lanmaoa asiatica]
MVALTDADEREIGQHFVFGFHGHEISEDAKTLIRDYHVGNIILMRRNVQSIKQVHGLVKSLQFAKDCGHTRPLMIGIDQENDQHILPLYLLLVLYALVGLVSAFSSTDRYTAGTQFPGAMALAATGDLGIARLCSFATAREMKLAGINWAYSPVVDPVCVCYSRANMTHAGVRSFGDGHGDTHVDSHLALPVIKKTEGELHETELIPFRALMSHGAPFGGVIVRDCLEMDAVAAKYTLQKGAVWCGYRDDLSHDGIADGGAVTCGVEGEDRRTQGAFCERVLGELDEGRLAEIVEANGKLSTRAYDASTAVIKGPLPEVGPGPEGESMNKACADASEGNAASEDVPAEVIFVTRNADGGVHCSGGDPWDVPVTWGLSDACTASSAISNCVVFFVDFRRMKLQKFFGRDKLKPAKVTPLGRDVDTATQPIIDEAGLHPFPSTPFPHPDLSLQDAISAHHPSFAPQPLLPSRPIPRPSNEDHWEVLQPGQPEDVIQVPSPRAHQQQFIAVIPSRSSSLGSLPQPGNSPQIPSTVPISPRSSSPFSITSNTITVQGAPRNQRSDDRILRRKSPPVSGGVAALGILKALEPHQELPPVQHPPDLSDDLHTYNEPVRIEKDRKERKGFWDGMLRDREKDKWRAEKERDRDRDRFERVRTGDRREDDLGTADLTRMIGISLSAFNIPNTDPLLLGYLTATASEDWSIVLEVCERASANEPNAKEAARALRREFKQVMYAEPKAQLAAARLWAIMLRNASDVFIQQISQRKFIEALEDVLTSPRTSPVVRERLMEVLAAAAFITSSRSQSAGKEKDKDCFRALWCRLKPADKPEMGVPFDTDDAMFSPPVVSLPRPLSQYSLETPTFAQTFSPDELAPTPPLSERPPPQSRRRYPQHRVIPLEEDIRRLFQECKIARGNADVLSQTLAFARPDALDADLIPEFLTKCRASQELIYTQVPWASAGAERSRTERDVHQHARTRSVTHGSQQDLILANMEDVPNELTVEEELLAALLDANEALVGALRMYDDLARVATERATEEKSRREVRMDRRQLNDDFFVEPPGAYTGSSDPPSPPLPSPTATPHQHFELPAVVPSPNHPLPRIPPSLVPSALAQNQPPGHYYGSQANTPTLLAPPHPLGPRSPAQGVTTSRTPSPDRIPGRPSGHGSVDSDNGHVLDVIERMNIEDDVSNSDDDLRTPIRPSDKALGKRRVVEDLDDGESNNAFFGRSDPFRDSAADSDSDEAGFLPKRQPTRYVYDAAAEHLYDDEFTVPLDDEYQSPVEPAPSSTLDNPPESTPTTTTSITNGKSEPSGADTLPAKPATTESSGLSYSAQVAKQFSAYQQTPSQERQQRSALTNPQAGPSAIATHEGSADRNSQERPIRPSEMKDEG